MATIELTLEEALKIYPQFPEIAEKGFTKDELTCTSYKLFKTYESMRNETFPYPKKQAEAIIKLTKIRYILNEGWTPKLNNECLYIPCFHLVTYPNQVSLMSDFIDKVTIQYGNTELTQLLLGGYYEEIAGVIGNNISDSLLACRTPAIAQHMSKYFGKEIFEAVYGNYNIKWWNVKFKDLL
jgi:hypothetical protein